MSVTCRSLTQPPKQNHSVDSESHLAKRAAQETSLCLFVSLCLLQVRLEGYSSSLAFSLCGVLQLYPLIFNKTSKKDEMHRGEKAEQKLI